MNCISTTGRNPWAASTNSDAGERAFGEGRIKDTILSEALNQTVGRTEHTAIDTDILTKNNDVLVL